MCTVIPDVQMKIWEKKQLLQSYRDGKLLGHGQGSNQFLLFFPYYHGENLTKSCNDKMAEVLRQSSDGVYLTVHRLLS